jgi:hypothetical protein
MGDRASWLAVRGKPAAVILEELEEQGLLVTRGLGEYVANPQYLGADLPGGWYLIHANYPFWLDEMPLEQLSLGAEIVTCFLSTTVMVSGASGWRDGQEIWSVFHDPDQDEGIEHLETEGVLPPNFAEIHRRITAGYAEDRQFAIEEAEAEGHPDEVWMDSDPIFNIPTELAEALTGFCHEDWTTADGRDISFKRLK